MIHKILVIDDNVESRSKIYTRLTRSYANINVAFPPSFNVELTFAKHPWEVPSLLKQNVFSFVILDIVLKDWTWETGNPVRATEILEKINDNTPVALLSSEWLAEEVKSLVAQWPTKKCKMFIHWQDIEDEQRINQGSLTRVLFELSQHVGNCFNVDYLVNIDENDPIRILHLSDLQFGGFTDWKLKLNAGHCATTIKRLWPNGPSFIVISGDIAEHGLPSEYDAAFKWISEFASQFSWTLPTYRILLVPGNHDACLPFATSSLLTLQEKKISTKSKKTSTTTKREFYVDFTKERTVAHDLTGYAFRPYLDFADKVAPRPYLSLPDDLDRRDATKMSFAWVEAKFRHLGIIFFGINTAQPITPGILPSRSVPIPTVEDTISELQTISKTCHKKPLVIGLTHHYPLPGPHEWAVDEPHHFEQLFTDVPSVALWLHGHWHIRETTIHSTRGGRLVVNSAPTLTVKEAHRPPDTARGFSMIDIQRKANKISSCKIFPVEWVGNALQIRESEGKTFELDDKGYFRDIS